MKYAFSTIACPEFTWNEILTMAHDLGFQGIEVRVRGHQLYSLRGNPFTEELLPATKKELERLHLEIPCLSSGCALKYADRTEATLGGTVQNAYRITVNSDASDGSFGRCHAGNSRLANPPSGATPTSRITASNTASMRFIPDIEHPSEIDYSQLKLLSLAQLHSLWHKALHILYSHAHNRSIQFG